MPLTEFICPDGNKCKVSECMKGCRLAGKINPATGMPYVPCGRCLSRRALYAISQDRKWGGKPSTTQLLNGTLEEFLKIKYPYAVNPLQSVFALHGTNVHANLEAATNGEGITEQRLDDGVSTGAFDFFDEEAVPEKDHGYLYDDKTYGSYVAAQILGAVQHKNKVGTYKNGKPKYKTTYTYDGVTAVGKWDVAVQMNDYRMKIENVLNKHVDKMICEMIVRDGNTYIATSRGVTEPAYLVNINKISDHWVAKYMKAKADNLISALKTGRYPKRCNYRERWGGMKCERYCNVKEYCPYYSYN